MGKKICKDPVEIGPKMEGRKMKYVCTKCDEEVAKEKWACKPKKIK